MTCVVVSSYGIGARETLPVVLAYTILHGIVAVLSLRYGYVRFTKVDTLLVMCSLAGVVLWYLTTSPWYALLINLCIDIFGYATIAYKTYLHPETEDRFAWAIGGLAYALNLLTIDVWVPEEYLFSLSNVFWCFTILLLTLFLAPKNRAF